MQCTAGSGPGPSRSSRTLHSSMWCHVHRPSRSSRTLHSSMWCHVHRPSRSSRTLHSSMWCHVHRPSRSSRTLHSSMRCHAHSVVQYRTDFVSWFAKFMLKSSTAQCTVQCALKVVVTREESWSAMAEWVMFDAALSDTCDLSSANFFPVSVLDVNLCQDI